jgi:hypothetical protein
VTAVNLAASVAPAADPNTVGKICPECRQCSRSQNRPTRWDVAVAGPSDSHHDLPELTAQLGILVPAVDDGLDRAGLQTFGDELDGGFAAGFINTRERATLALALLEPAVTARRDRFSRLRLGVAMIAGPL